MICPGAREIKGESSIASGSNCSGLNSGPIIKEDSEHQLSRYFFIFCSNLSFLSASACGKNYVWQSHCNPTLYFLL
jgi:hypothetical protein